MTGTLPALSAFSIAAIFRIAGWENSDQERHLAQQRKRRGETLVERDKSLNRFTFFDLFLEPELRRRVILAFFMSVATSLGWYGISLWVPPHIASIATQGAWPPSSGQPSPAWPLTPVELLVTSRSASFGYLGT